MATAGLLAALTATAACASDGGPAAAQVVRTEHPQVAPGDHLPASGDVLLTVVDGSERRRFDLAGLDRLGRVSTELYEPYVKRTLDFEGVSARDLATYLDLDRGDRLRALASDDYEVTLEVGALIDSDAVLATRSAGTDIPMADGGPVRLVFPADPLATDVDAWIWSVDTLVVERG